MKHMPKKKYDKLMKQEERERARIQELVGQIMDEAVEKPDTEE